MSQNHNRVKGILDSIETNQEIEAFKTQVSPKKLSEEELNGSSAYSNGYSAEDQRARLDFLKEKGNEFEYINGETQFTDVHSLKGNIENFIGMAQVPIGLAGPLLINGSQANGEFYVPLATTEGALVASYSRGMKACRAAGGISSVCIAEGIQRSPFFKFESIFQVGKFIKWVHSQEENFHEIVSKSSRFAKLLDLHTNMEGNSVILTFDFSTGDAAGQNMVTICTDKICKFILSNFEIKPKEWYIESNYSGDKKATFNSYNSVRGKKVTTETFLPREIVEKVLKTTPELIVKYWKSSTLAVIQSGAIGAQGHVANGLTALFLACGQDVACIAESSIGITRMEIQDNGGLYVSVTLPSLAVGTVGGGTSLPTQKECLELLGCSGAGKARKFSEICGALCLAGELSIASAMSVDHFTSAHENLGR